MMLEDLYRLLRSGHVQAQGVVDTMTQPIVVLDQRMCVTTANNAFVRTFQVERDDILGESLFDLGNGQWDITDLRSLIASVIPKAAAIIGFEVHHDFPGIGQRTFLIDARRLVHPDENSTNILVLFNDVTDNQRRNAEMEFVLSETRHRMKNLFAVVRALVMQTKAEGRTAIEYRDTLLGRLETTLQAQEMAAHTEGSDITTLLGQLTAAPWAARIHCDGPAVQLGSDRILPVGMIFHELATNAIKYGALSVPNGEVHITWSRESDPDGKAQLHCEWREQNGPSVRPPELKGYGSELIQGTATHLGGGAELNYDPKGLVAAIKFPL